MSDAPFKFPETDLAWLQDHTLFLTKHGSQAYGTATAESDTDYKGFAVPPRKYVHGFLHSFEQAEWHDPDMVIYDIRKFFRLAADCNPSIIEVLFTDERHHVKTGGLARQVLDHRQLFLSKKAKHTFSGYALSQLKRIRGHNRWLRDPPKAPPSRDELGLPARTIIPADQRDAAKALIRKKLESWELPVDDLDMAAKVALAGKLEAVLTEVAGTTDLSWHAGRALGFSDNFLELLDKERLYTNRKTDWDSYQRWVASRNPARAQLEAKYGYDTKHGMHLVRLLRMGREILEGRGVLVDRPDAVELLEIRNGAWPYEQLVEWAEREERGLDELYKTSTALPVSPDRVKLDTLCVEIVEEMSDPRR